MVRDIRLLTGTASVQGRAGGKGAQGRMDHRLAGESEVNANPKDTADWPNGVWTLPPTLSQKDKDREKYLAIGESDRMPLRFVKPR